MIGAWLCMVSGFFLVLGTAYGQALSKPENTVGVSWGLLIVWAVLAVLGIVVQYRFGKAPDKK